MKRFFVLFAVMALFVGVANAQDAIFEHNNEIGIYVTETPTAESAEADACYMGAPGQFMAYVVLTNPYNVNTGAPISNVGGFEFRLEIPAVAFLLGNTLPPASTNFATPPNFFVGTNAPVVDGRCTLVTLALGNFGGAPGEIFMGPVPEIASIPGACAITDANDGFSISEAFPVSGSFDAPVFGMFTCVVDNEDASWGAVKSLYR